eukprot:GHVL01004388.1.p1 GENE.GHVL01004388.1~~GHVL01004388.1.p1  ORF type:complete len:287 (+),score=54.49 GHVL01004388.1:15-875(+)
MPGVSGFLEEVFLIHGSRTPIGSFLGSLSGVPATKLGSTAITSAIYHSSIEPKHVDAVIMGHVLTAGCGQNSVRQAALGAEIPIPVDCFGINKVCASGMKAIHLGAESIALKQHDVVVCGGMENMSQVPFFLRHARKGGYGYGHGQLEDSVLSDGLWDPYNNLHMGSCTEELIQKMGISREEQDNYCLESYKRAANAWSSGAMANEVTSVKVKEDIIVDKDEEYKKIKIEKVAGLKPAFGKEGTITAANASSLNDGAAAVVLMSLNKCSTMGLNPSAKVEILYLCF